MSAPSVLVFAAPPKGTLAAPALHAARGAYIRLLGSVGRNAEVEAEVTCFCEKLDQMQVRMLDPKARKRPTTLRLPSKLAGN
jgi:hypothetical protein